MYLAKIIHCRLLARVVHIMWSKLARCNTAAYVYIKLFKTLQDTRNKKMSDNFTVLRSCWSGAHRSGSEATMNILAENMAFMSLFRAKMDCSVTCVTPHEQYGIFMLVFFMFVEFFLSLKLQNSYVDETMSPEPESTKWWLISGWSIPPKQAPAVGLLLQVKILQALRAVPLKSS